MALTAGTRLGPYQIADQLGAGGMGEVYRATDTRLDRTVAIKVLPEHLASDPQRRERFEREARAVSSLNHPHICTLHDIGEQNGTHYLVMELIEGQTLQQRLEKERLPVDQALEYAIQIADALDKAHRKGVVHRDLKPGNIMLTKSAGVKLLDFGLAKLKGDAGTVSPLSQMPTQDPSTPLTAEGTIIGTLQYMAPEQLEGKEADPRTDIFAFGAVVYEMVTGKKAFDGASPASLIGAILKDVPPLVSDFQPISPTTLDRTVKKCLAKDPDGRWQSTGDLLDELKWVTEGSASVSTSTVEVGSKNRGRIAWIAATAVLVVLVVVLGRWYLGQVLEEPRAVRFSIAAPEGAILRAPGLACQTCPAVSPDGGLVAFLAESEGRTLLWIRPLDSLTAQVLSGTEGASYPFWSPDSRSIGFFAQGKLNKIAVSGGPPQTLSDGAPFYGGTWNENDTIVFTNQNRLYRISSSGGPATPVTDLDAAREERLHAGPHFLPGGRHFLYFASSTNLENRGVYVASLDSQESRFLFRSTSRAEYARPGYLVFVRDGTLMAQAFDIEQMQLSGEPTPVAEQVVNSNAGVADFSTSENGILVYLGGFDTALEEFVWFDRSGRQLGRIGGPGAYESPTLSPDGKRLAFESVDPLTGNQDIWTMDLDRGVSPRFTFDAVREFRPIWSHDGTQIVFSSNRDGPNSLYRKTSFGSGNDELLLQADASLVAADARLSPIDSSGVFAMDWSSDGRFLAYQRGGAPRTDIWVLPLDRDSEPYVFLQTEFSELHARFSSDARWIAYASNESGPYEVYVQRFPATGDKWQISINGGMHPRWRGDGRELFYLTPDGSLMAVEVRTDGTFEAGVSAALFEPPIGTTDPLDSPYAVTTDGQRFLIVAPAEEDSPTSRETPSLTVVLNWTTELENQ